MLLAVLGLLGLACGDSDDSDDSAEQEAEAEAEETVDQVGARAAAETVRANLTARRLDDGGHLRDVEILEDVVNAVPGSPEVRGLEDTTGDGRDDDGRLELLVGEESACVSVSEDGETIDAEGGSCS